MLRIAIIAALLIVAPVCAGLAQEPADDESAVGETLGSAAIAPSPEQIEQYNELAEVHWQDFDPRRSRVEIVVDYAGRITSFPLSVLAGCNCYEVTFELRHCGRRISQSQIRVLDGSYGSSSSWGRGPFVLSSEGDLQVPPDDWQSFIRATPGSMLVPERFDPVTMAVDGLFRRGKMPEPPPAVLAAARQFTIGGVELLVYCPEADEFSVSVTRWFQPGFRLEYLPDELVPVLNSTDPGEREYLGSLTAALR